MVARYYNPIIPGCHPDPSICRAGEDYFLVTSSFEYFPGVPLFHSRDLVHWRQIGHCLTTPTQLPLPNVRPSGGIFAPTIRYHDGTFYMVTTNVNAKGNFFVTTRDPFGPWSEPVWLEQDGIDPSLMFGVDGRVYLTTTGHAPDPADPARMAQVIQQSEIDPATGQLLTKPRVIWGGTGGSYPEGPHLYHIGERYYLMNAEGGTEYGHMETIARSDSPWGPWESCPHNPILTHRSTSHPIQALGHADIVEAHDGTWWLVCLGIRPNGQPRTQHLGRETCLAPVTWDADGWPHVGDGGRVALEMDAPRLTPVEWPAEPERDDFDSQTLGLRWNLTGNTDRAAWSLAERPGALRLLGNSTHLDDGLESVFAGVRQEHFNCEVSTLLDYSPAQEGEQAGLTVWMNPRHHYDLYLTRDDGERRIVLRGRIGDLASTIAERTILGSGPVTLKVRAGRHSYSFSYSGRDADEIVEMGTLQARYLAAEVAGGFTGVYFGLYAYSDAPNPTPAYFEQFDYRSLERPGALTVDSTLRQLLADDAARSVVGRYLPALTSSAQPDFWANMPLSDLAAMSPDVFPATAMRAIADALRDPGKGRMAG